MRGGAEEEELRKICSDEAGEATWEKERLRRWGGEQARDRRRGGRLFLSVCELLNPAVPECFVLALEEMRRLRL